MRVSSLRLITALIALTLMAGAPRAASIDMVHDYDDALALAKKSGKPVLIDFYADT